MAILHIKDWLENPNADYSAGFKLYNQHGTSLFLKSFFEKSNDVYTRERLTAELRAIVKANDLLPPPPPPAQPISEPVKSTIPEKKEFKINNPVQLNKIDSSKLPIDLQKLASEKGLLFRRVNSLHAKLELFATNDERRAAAVQIVKDFKRIEAIWEQLDYFEKHGVRKSKGIVLESLSLIQLVKRKANLRTYVTKLVKANPEDPRILQHKDEQARIDQLLKEAEEEYE